MRARAKRRMGERANGQNGVWWPRPVGRKTRRANDVVSLAGYLAPVLSRAVRVA
jgi:hypothetical protein